MTIVHKNCRIAYGCTRTVFLIGSWAIKVPAIVEWRLFLLGLLANMQERIFARSGWPELCPIVFSLPGGWLVIMRRAREMTQKEFNTFNVEQWLNCEEYTIPAEPKQDSFGWLNGKIVAIDYGN